MQKEKSAQPVAKSALHFAVGTFFSRISGMLREITMAYTLGTSAAAAAFLIAFRFAYLMRRILGEGALVNGFIPHYETMRAISPQNAAFFFRDLLVTLGFLLLAIISVAEISLGIALYTGVFSLENSEIVQLIMLMLPGLFFICFFALQSGFLQCHGQFLLTAVAPAAFNIAWVGTLIWYRHSPASAITAHLSIALGFALFFQWLLLWRHTSAHLRGFLALRDWFQSTLFSKEIRLMLKGIALSIIAVSATQVNGFIDMLFARYADLEGPAYLSYAIRLQQLPLALFGIAIASALFPALARALQAHDEDEVRSLLHFGLMRSFTLMLPCTLGIIVLGGPAVNLLFGRGIFTALSSTETTLCLWGYGLGLLPATYALLFAQGFFIRKNYLTPTAISIASMLFNTACNALLILIFHMGALSIAIATSVSALFQAVILMMLYRRRYGSLHFWVQNKIEIGKLFLATLLATALTLYFTHSWQFNFPREFWTQLSNFLLPFGAFALSFIFLCWILRAGDICSLLTRQK